MKVTEKPLTSEEIDEITQLSAEGMKSLGIDEAADPISIVTAINSYVEKERVHIQNASEDDYAWLILSMAYLWGNQVC